MYDGLLKEAAHHGIRTQEQSMPVSTKGLYADNVIWINKNIPTNTEKACVLAEEMGHYHTSAGSILDQSKLSNRKQERRARCWSFQRLFPLQKIVQAHIEGVTNRYELAEYLDVTEEFIQSALDWYIEKYGTSVVFGEHTIAFEPLNVSRNV